MLATVNGVALNWQEAGKSADNVLVLIHGFPFSSAIWRHQLERPPEGWRVVAPDLRGFGGSSPVNGTRLPMDLLAADIAELLRHLGVGRAVIGGLSMGGYVVFAFLRRFPKMVRGLLLSDTRAGADSEEARQGRLKNAKHVHAHGTQALIDAMLPKLVAGSTRRERPGVVEELRRIMEAVPAATVVASLVGMAARHDATPLLRHITVPTQIIVGEDDQITPAGESRLMARAVRGSRIEVITGAGHVPNLEQPSDFNRALGVFLAPMT